MSNAQVLMTPGMGGENKAAKNALGEKADAQGRSGEFNAVFEQLGKGKEQKLPESLVKGEIAQQAPKASVKAGVAPDGTETALHSLLAKVEGSKKGAAQTQGQASEEGKGLEAKLLGASEGDTLENAEKALKDLLAATGSGGSAKAKDAELPSETQLEVTPGAGQDGEAAGAVSSEVGSAGQGLAVALAAVSSQTSGQAQVPSSAATSAAAVAVPAQASGERGKTVDLAAATATAGKEAGKAAAASLGTDASAAKVAVAEQSADGKLMPSNASEKVTVDLAAAKSGAEGELPKEAGDVKVLKAETHFMPAADLKGPTRQVANALLGPDNGLGDPAKLARELSQTAQNVKNGNPVKTLEIQLRPDNLGTVKVSMQLVGNELEITMTASSKDAADMLQRDALALTKVLRDAGYRTDSTNITINHRNDGSDQLKQQFAGQGDRGASGDKAGEGRQGGESRGDEQRQHNGRDQSYQEGMGGETRTGVDARDLRDGIYL